MRLFLYGTLMDRAETPIARWLADRVSEAEVASAPGRLIAVPSDHGWFPALLPGSGQVRGTLVRVALGPGELARLDRYEGREYRRATLRVRAGRGRVSAQAWIWRAPLPRGAEPIAGGDFLAWLAASRRAAFATR